jgi:hypothetical protein
LLFGKFLVKILRKLPYNIQNVVQYKYSTYIEAIIQIEKSMYLKQTSLTCQCTEKE